MATNPALWGTTCSLFIDVIRGDSIEPDSFITTSGGSAYLVLSCRRMASRHPNRWALRVARIDPESVPPDAAVIELQWYHRRRRVS